MTTIIAVRDENQTLMIADGLCESAEQVVMTDANKIIRFDDLGLLVGFSGDTRVHHTLKYSGDLGFYMPGYASVEHFLFASFVPRLRGLLKERDLIEENRMEGALLIASKDAIFKLSSGFGVDKIDKPYFAVGSGADYALGAICGMSLIDTEILAKFDTEELARFAMSAARAYDPFTGGEITIERLGK